MFLHLWHTKLFITQKQSENTHERYISRKRELDTNGNCEIWEIKLSKQPVSLYAIINMCMPIHTHTQTHRENKKNEYTKNRIKI